MCFIDEYCIFFISKLFSRDDEYSSFFRFIHCLKCKYCLNYYYVGGSYGFARVTMGPYLGFVIGCFDAITNIFYSLTVLQYLCTSIVEFTGDAIPPHSEPIQWLILYVFCLTTLIGLGRWSFPFISLQGIIVLCICIAFVFSTADRQNFHKYVVEKEGGVLFAGRFVNFMQCLPIANWLYLGIDMLCLVCDDTENVGHS